MEKDQWFQWSSMLLCRSLHTAQRRIQTFLLQSCVRTLVLLLLSKGSTLLYYALHASLVIKSNLEMVLERSEDQVYGIC